MIPGTTSPRVHLVLIIPIVTAGTHMNGVGALGRGENKGRVWSRRHCGLGRRMESCCFP